MVAGVNGVNANHAVTELTASVAAVNDRGLRLADEAQWRNYSKWAADFTRPSAGDRVRLTLDGGGFVRNVVILTPEPAPRQVRSVGAQDAPEAGPNKDTTITRLACLKAAAAFCAWRQDVTPEDVLDIAGLWEGWVTR